MLSNVFLSAAFHLINHLYFIVCRIFVFTWNESIIVFRPSLKVKKVVLTPPPGLILSAPLPAADRTPTPPHSPRLHLFDCISCLLTRRSGGVEGGPCLDWTGCSNNSRASVFVSSLQLWAHSCTSPPTCCSHDTFTYSVCKKEQLKDKQEIWYTSEAGFSFTQT